MNAADVVALSLALVMAVPILLAYVADLAGLPMAPVPIAIMTIALVGLALTRIPRRPWRVDGVLAGFAAVLVAVLGYLLWLTWPAFLPPGSGPDLTHHLILIDYIEQHRRLVHDPAAGAYLGEMAHYTPGLHLLAAIAGVLIRADGFHTVYAVVAGSVAIKLGIVYLIGCRLCPERLRPAVGQLAVVFCVAASRFTFGSFVEDSFLAQALAELFAVAAWWSILLWDRRPAPFTMAITGVLCASVFLTWPVWIGPVVLVLAGTVLARLEMPVRERLAHAAYALTPLTAAAIAHSVGRTAWVSMVQTSGAVLQPTPAVLGWWLPALGVLGIVLGVRQRTLRPVLMFVTAIAIQAAALLIVARAADAATPYMAIKMVYLAIYPLGVAAAAATLVIPARGLWVVRAAAIVATLLVVRDLAEQRAPSPVVAEDLFRAGVWARERVPAPCVDYLVGNEYTAYWLHLAVLRNPRASTRTRDDTTFLTQPAIERWIAGRSLPYAIANLRVLPAEIRQEVDRLAQFGQAAVVKSRVSVEPAASASPSQCSVMP